MTVMNVSLDADIVLKEYKNAFSRKKPNDLLKFEFIRKYMKVYSELYDNTNNLFLITNPMLELENVKDKNNIINVECIKFLIGKTQQKFKNNENKNSRVVNERYFKKLAEEKGLAYSLIGMVYELGAFSIKQDIIKAVNFYITSSKYGNTLGTFRLAMCFEKGLGKCINFSKALAFYRCSAKLGGVEAMHTYGSILINGTENVKREQTSGLLYLKMATKLASESYPYPYFDLASIYEDPGDFIDIWKDENYAFTLYLKGASLGCSNCMYRIGKAYQHGELKRKINVKQMIFYYNKAASMLHIEGMYMMALNYSIGHAPYLEKNTKLAYDLAVKAATRHHVNAAFLVAQILESDKNFCRDPVMVLWWYKIAESMGHTQASGKIKKLMVEINMKTGITKSPKKCILF